MHSGSSGITTSGHNNITKVCNPFTPYSCICSPFRILSNKYNIDHTVISEIFPLKVCTIPNNTINIFHSHFIRLLIQNTGIFF